MLRHLRVLPFLFGPALATSAQEVLVVAEAAGPGVDFTELSTAASMAPDGATLLIRDGSYSNEFVLIDGKSLVLTAEQGASVRMTGQIEIRNLGVGQLVLVSNIEVDPTNFSENLTILDCAGEVWIEDCSFTAFALNLFTSPDAIIVSNSDSVVFVDTSAVGGAFASFVSVSGSGLRSIDSSIHLFRCSMTGGVGGTDTTQAGAGGDGVVVDGGFLFAADSTFEGGIGGTAGSIFGCMNLTGGPGGSGLHLIGASPNAQLLNPTLVGGDGGPVGGPGNCTVGPVGAASVVESGSISQAFGTPHDFQVTNPVETGLPVQLDFQGEPGGFVWYLFGGEQASLFLVQVLGTLVVDFPLFVIPAGTLDGAGLLSLSVAAPALPLGDDSGGYYLQSLYLEGPVFTLSQPVALVVLAPGF